MNVGVTDSSSSQNLRTCGSSYAKEEWDSCLLREIVTELRDQAQGSSSRNSSEHNARGEKQMLLEVVDAADGTESASCVKEHVVKSTPDASQSNQAATPRDIEDFGRMHCQVYEGGCCFDTLVMMLERCLLWLQLLLRFGCALVLDGSICRVNFFLIWFICDGGTTRPNRSHVQQPQTGVSAAFVAGLFLEGGCVIEKTYLHYVLISMV
ncbi:hypothetical protein KIW84_066264 [Lathyrus oleraceus]|uniref:Uncharacterized protein n=1 Tax=Pisum sativum TaxID=3888 RepID=A0A9D4WJ26_PEA|nr:hypothetical protein KIW84_066264 [Pisum sativum]